MHDDAATLHDCPVIENHACSQHRHALCILSTLTVNYVSNRDTVSKTSHKIEFYNQVVMCISPTKHNFPSNTLPSLKVEAT